MTIPSTQQPPTTIQTPLYDLSLRFHERKSFITIYFKTTFLHTSDLPATIPVLTRHLPTIFDATCFNDNNFSFRKEVEDTELGHLFEHILLEYLCLIKSTMRGGDDIMFGGVTKWNWGKDARGTFHITFQSGLSEVYTFKKALEKAIELINKIIEESESALPKKKEIAPAYVPVKN